MQYGTKKIMNIGQHNRGYRVIFGRIKQPLSKSSRSQANANGAANAKRSYERYMTLARNSASTGDAIEIENYYQHAEHYLRLMRGRAI